MPVEALRRSACRFYAAVMPDVALIRREARKRCAGVPPPPDIDARCRARHVARQPLTLSAPPAVYAAIAKQRRFAVDDAICRYVAEYAQHDATAQRCYQRCRYADYA